MKKHTTTKSALPTGAEIARNFKADRIRNEHLRAHSKKAVSGNGKREFVSTLPKREEFNALNAVVGGIEKRLKYPSKGRSITLSFHDREELRGAIALAFSERNQYSREEITPDDWQVYFQTARKVLRLDRRTEIPIEIRAEILPDSMVFDGLDVHGTESPIGDTRNPRELGEIKRRYARNLARLQAAWRANESKRKNAMLKRAVSILNSAMECVIGNGFVSADSRLSREGNAGWQARKNARKFLLEMLSAGDDQIEREQRKPALSACDEIAQAMTLGTINRKTLIEA